MAGISLILSFIVFVLIIYKPASKALAKALDNKSELLDHDISEAEDLRNSANNSLIRAKTRLVEAELLAEQIRSNAILSAKTVKDHAETKLESVKSKKRKSALIFIEYKKRKYALKLKDTLLDEAIRSIRSDITSSMATCNDHTSETINRLSSTIKRFTLH
ncbi:ATP synthase subunit b [Candidatus Cyrtobacter comes]|uniref:ATP synthase subunit b n=1 Tax=Candidatus Cyrtobacter comes TaxID=675776 RepID=A0ABU5L8M7_9RICK|nr:ATP synthase F0 subunit B [Candidatus Cyrtobacter comes]MDZ5762275.1 ATP synthase subunit b [Candidatus Cyrtobacter comes]